jgi:hypothetical protein
LKKDGTCAWLICPLFWEGEGDDVDKDGKVVDIKFGNGCVLGLWDKTRGGDLNGADWYVYKSGDFGEEKEMELGLWDVNFGELNVVVCKDGLVKLGLWTEGLIFIPL